MNLTVKIYSCYKLTYERVYKDVLMLIYNDKEIVDSAKLEIIDISDDGKNNIQSQRSIDKYATRTINIYENKELKHIVGISNTNYDYDKKDEYEKGKSIKDKNTFGMHNYHANTYLKQGIPSIFNYYFENKCAKLSFYLLDTKESYPHNLYNVLSYRELENIGFKILNINEVNFSDYNKCCNSNINSSNIKFSSFNKYLRDISYISKKNKGNMPSYLQCNEYIEETKGSEDYNYVTESYSYIFKSLSAQGYDSLLRCWCLKVLADKENKVIKFRLGKQYFAYEAEEKKVADKLTGPILDTFKNANINIEYVTDNTFLTEKKVAEETYLRYKEKNELRNQTLFRNNLRRKGIPLECACCGQDNTSILDAAHIFEINRIKEANIKEINDFIKNNNLNHLIDENSKYKNEVFFKKYSIANAGDNGIWLCKNHHGLFDKNYFCFDGKDGKIVLYFNDEKAKEDFINTIKENCKLNDQILTEITRVLLNKRNSYLK